MSDENYTRVRDMVERKLKSGMAVHVDGWSSSTLKAVVQDLAKANLVEATLYQGDQYSMLEVVWAGPAEIGGPAP